MPKKIRKPVEPVSLPEASQYFYPRDWKDFTAKVEQEFDRKSLYRGPDPDPARESKRQLAISLTAIEYAHAESMKAFWIDVQKGKLILVGYLIPGDGRLLQIPNHALDDPDSSFDFKKAKISGSGLCFVNVGVLTASEAKNVPEFCGAKEELPEGPAFPRARKGKPGRQRIWNWDAANRDMIRLANTPDGLPSPQAAIEKHIQNWFLAHYNDSPAESQIRKFVVDRLPENYRDED